MQVLRWALVLAPVVLVVAAAWSRRWIDDDGFINFRVVSELLHGHGPVFNPGERVEAVTSPLWVYLLAAGDAVLPIRLEWVAVLEGLAFTGVGFAFLVFGSARLQARRFDAELWLPAGAAVLAALTPIWTFGTSGLENGLIWLWLGGCLLLMARWTTSSRRLSVAGSVVLGLGPLIRPEFALFSAAFVIAVVIGDRAGGWRSRLLVIGAALSLPVAYEIFRMGYYAQLVPNSALAKSAAGARWGAGWSYLVDTFRPYWLWLPIAILAVGAYFPLARQLKASSDPVDGRRGLVAVAFIGGAIVDLLYVVRVGGDYMHSRLLLPGLIALVAPVAVVPWRRAYRWSLLVLPWALVAGLALRSSSDAIHYFYAATAHPVTVDDFGWGEKGPFLKAYAQPGVYLGNQRLSRPLAGHPAKIVATTGIGVESYAVGPEVYVVDMLGLGNVVDSHFELHHRGLNSHEKPMPSAYAAALLTSPASAVPLRAFRQDETAGRLAFGIRPLFTSTASSFPDDVAAARRALGCSSIERLTHDVRSRLTPSQFMTNLWHALPNTTLQIPADPVSAERRFCH